MVSRSPNSWWEDLCSLALMFGLIAVATYILIRRPLP